MSDSPINDVNKLQIGTRIVVHESLLHQQWQAIVAGRNNGRLILLMFYLGWTIEEKTPALYSLELDPSGGIVPMSNLLRLLHLVRQRYPGHPGKERLVERCLADLQS